MRLTLRRKIFDEHDTIGDLCVDSQWECFTLEDRVRNGPKVPNETAIPCGIYKVIIDFSNRFKRLMPHILDVPGFTGIRIHSGNTDADTEGCILVGQHVASDTEHDRLSNDSRQAAFNTLYPKLKAAFDVGNEITIEILPAS